MGMSTASLMAGGSSGINAVLTMGPVQKTRTTSALVTSAVLASYP